MAVRKRPALDRAQAERARILAPEMMGLILEIGAAMSPLCTPLQRIFRLKRLQRHAAAMAERILQPEDGAMP